ncbi:putative RING finger protein P32A8.03c [Spatholobus suberectus]|nr:putative RING finger protein P32A8.03c [Spatholobus suberectus]
MAGMLPGVECARRRRLHRGLDSNSTSSASHASTRRSSFCLYASNHESRLSSSSSTLTHPDENMGGAAKEAKQRLDDKFRAQRMSENKRYNKIKTNKFLLLRSDYANQHKMCGGQKNKHSRVAQRGIWVKEKWFKEIQLDQMELEGLSTRGLCRVLGIIQDWRDTDASSLCP